MSNKVRTSRCPYCLQTEPSSTSATPSSKDAPEDVLDAEIERVEKLVSDLLLERSRLRRKRNEMRSPIYSLPQEILAIIFKFTLPPFDFSEIFGSDSFARDKAPHPGIMGVLAAVSVHWHNVVLSTPSLWTSFVADDHDVNAMQTIFARSGNLPVVASLEFPIDSLSYKPHTAALSPVLQNNASRIRMLHVFNASPTWLKEHAPSFVNLEQLYLRVFHGNRDESVVIEGSLTGLPLKNFECLISLSWSKIEVLHLNNMFVDDCLELLEKCTHLREFRLRDPFGSRLDGSQLPSSPFALPFLELFEWTVDDEDPVDRAMLQYIRMPALRTLVWNEVYPNLNSLYFLSSFFEHLPSTLSVVQLQKSTMHPNFSVFSYILNLSNIEGLIFKHCSDSFMDSVFDTLGSEMHSVENQEMPVLPKLKSIYIDNFLGRLHHPLVLQVLQRRCSQPLESLQEGPFRLEFENHHVDWEPEFKEELIRMVEKGYRVELWEDSKLVDWLPRVKLPQT